MDIIRHDSIEDAAEKLGRVYLCGNLKRSNGLEHIVTDGYEIGFSYYDAFTFEKAHYHAFNREYNYVLQGQIKIFILNEKKEYLFGAGDLFAVNTNEPYVGKSMAGTRTLFSKVPGGDDKVLVPMDEQLMAWGSTWEAEYPGFAKEE